MPVAAVFENLELGTSIDEIIEQYDVTREQIQAVLEFAARSLYAPPVPTGASNRADARPFDQGVPRSWRVVTRSRSHEARKPKWERILNGELLRMAKEGSERKSYSVKNGNLVIIRHIIAALTLTLATVALLAQPPAPRRPPKIQFVEVESAVHLEVVDWGGSGRSIVLLAGGGETAHVYDRFAEQLASEHHVFGITRRGFGTSSKPRTGYTAEGLANDVLRVLDALKLEKPILAGHSVAGEELFSIGARFSNRIAALIYLDAASDRTYVPPRDGKDRSAKEGDFNKVGIHDQPRPDPERFDPTDEVRAGVEKPDYARIRVPALALYAAPRTWKEMMPGSPEFTDPEKLAAAERVVAQMARIRKYMADTFRSGVANSRVVEIPGASHYIFRTNEVDVLREMRTFIGSLDR